MKQIMDDMGVNHYRSLKDLRAKQQRIESGIQATLILSSSTSSSIIWIDFQLKMCLVYFSCTIFFGEDKKYLFRDIWLHMILRKIKWYVSRIITILENVLYKNVEFFSTKYAISYCDGVISSKISWNVLETTLHSLLFWAKFLKLL